MTTTMPHQGMMMGPMKGHLAPNSSPFKPTINKLSSQDLIQDQMSSHYRKLGTARAAIDNKPPKSMATSVKKRDQMKRETLAKQMKLFDFEKEMKHGSASPHRQTPDSTLYGSQRSFSVTVTKNGYDEARPQSASSFRSGRLSPHLRTSSSPRSLSASNSLSPRDKTRKPDILNQTYSGDYLERHEDRFKNNNEPFTPRLKKRSGKSYLSQSKHYAPPLVLHKEAKRKTAPKTGEEHLNSTTPTSSSSDLNAQQQKLASREEKKSKGVEDETDSMQRLDLDDRNRSYDNIYSERSYYDGYGFRQSQMSGTFFGSSSLGKSLARTESFSHETKNRIQAEEEEMKYLEFINTVTNEILTRGIYSDRVLTQVMQRHLDLNSGRLNEGRMRHMLMKLQEDLGVSADLTTLGFSTGPKYTSSYDAPSVSGYDYHAGGRKEADYHRTPSRKTSNERVLSGKKETTSEAVKSSGEKNKRKSKPPATSSGSEPDLKLSTLSSGEEEDKSHSKKVAIQNANAEKGNDVVGDISEKEIADVRATEANAPKPVKRTSVEKKEKKESF